MAKILVVEDNADLLALVVLRLQRAGHRVQDALHPTDALELVRTKGAPEVVVLDVSMPVLSGLELLVALREVTGRADLPAVFLSGRAEPEEPPHTSREVVAAPSSRASSAPIPQLQARHRVVTLQRAVAANPGLRSPGSNREPGTVTTTLKVGQDQA